MKVTNGEIIRKLLNGCDIADEELAKIRICPYNVSETCNIDMECNDCRLKWLKKDCFDFQQCAYHREDISNERQESSTAASRILSCATDEIDGDYDTLDTSDIETILELIASKRIESSYRLREHEYIDRLDKLTRYFKNHFLSECDLAE